MRWRLAVCLFGLGVLGSAGCSVVADGTRNTVLRVRRKVEDCREWHRDWRWAEQAWAVFLCNDPQQTYTGDFARGFQEGFAEHLYRGTIEPPPVAPARYRAPRNQSPEGYRGAEDWFAGFRQGVAAARATGYREFVTGPSSLRMPAAPTSVPVEPLPAVARTPAVKPGPKPAPPARPVAAKPAADGRGAVSRPAVLPPSEPAPCAVAKPDRTPAAKPDRVVAPASSGQTDPSMAH